MLIQYIAETAIRSAAEGLLAQHSLLAAVPVDVEKLVEDKLGLDIIPIPGFQSKFGVEGVLSQDLTSISVDEGVMQNVAPRYRFTLAHELGHYVLHGALIRHHLQSAGDKPLMLWETLPLQEYKRAEYQANTFAATILMPTQHLQTMFNEVSKTLAGLGKTFEDLEDYSKMKVLRSQAANFFVSGDALRIRLMNEGLIQPFDNPERGGLG